MSQVYDPRIPWISYTSAPQGGFYVRDARTGETVWAPDESGVHQFAADRSGRGRGLGDFVHGITSRLGIRRCGSCAQRQAWLNARTPGNR